MGAEPNASTSKEHTLVNARFLDEDLDKAFEVIAEMVARPTFADLDQEREVVLEEVAMYEDSPPELIHDDLCRGRLRRAPARAAASSATTETLAALDLDTVRGYHDEHYVNPGDRRGGRRQRRPRAPLRAGRARTSGRSRAPSCAAPELSAPRRRHVARFTRKDTEQYHVCLGGPGPRRGDPDRYAVFVVDTILGGSWSSRLFQEVREKRGLAYSVYSYTSLYADAGLTAVYFGSRAGGRGGGDERHPRRRCADLEARHRPTRPSSAPRTTSRASSC